MKTHNIPTTPWDIFGGGHFKSEATVLVEGSNNPAGWLVGGWETTAEGRIVYQGPMVKGPYGYMAGSCSVIDNHGGTGAILAKADKDGLLFRVKAGDTVTMSGINFTVTVDRRGYPHLEPVSALGLLSASPA